MVGTQSNIRRIACAAALLPLTALLLLLGRFIGLQSLSALGESRGWWAEYLLLLGPALLLWAAFGRHWAVWLAEGIPVLLLSLVSFYKQRINGTPLELGDFSLLSGAGEIVGFALPQAKLTGAVAIALGAWLAVLGLLILFGGRLLSGRTERLNALLLGAILLLLLLILPAVPRDLKGCGPVLRLYAAWTEARSGPGSQSADPAVLEAIRSQVDAAAEKPAPSEAPAPAHTAAGPSPAPTPTPAPLQPSVIFLMSESFFDVTAMPGTGFETDPLKHFHSLCREGVSGDFISPTYCGGTGYVEMEVLTGICSGLLRSGDTLTSLPEEKYGDLPCLTDALKAQGYASVFIHSYNDRLYNRRTVYTAFGFDELRFEEDFPEGAARAGGYLSDGSLTAEILAALDVGEGPKLIFAVSMENHQPYNAAKFGEPCASGLRCPGLDGEETAVLEAYVRGAEDADAALGALAAALKTREEPVLLVFWGDHRPNLGLPDGRNVYAALGCCTGTDTEAWQPEELRRMLTTNFLLWANYGLEPARRTESSTLLGLHVLERLGCPLTDWFRWLQMHAEGEYLMYRPRLYVDGEGTAYARIPPQAELIMDTYGAAVGDVVYGGGTIFRKYRR